jgi:H/ACA ribonucleoprotein complex subunit 4
MSEPWILEPEATTEPAHGCAPDERSIEQLLSAAVILLDKPTGPSSHQLAAWAKDLIGLEKMGHGGTLDPFATGVLPLLLGKTMRLTGAMLGHDKCYIAVMRFSEAPTSDELASASASLQGRIYNVPPEISAVKVQVRTRTVSVFEVLDIDGNYAVMKIKCEAGTYIRTIARDLGLLLAQEVELVELRRTNSGVFGEYHCVTMEAIADAFWLWKTESDESALRKILLPIEALIEGLPQVVVKDAAVGALSHGAPLARPGVVSASKAVSKGETVRIMTLKGEVVALAELIVDSDALQEMSNGEVAKSQSVLMDIDVYPRAWKAE